jgi:Ni/Co efflux regulator RcnB
LARRQRRRIEISQLVFRARFRSRYSIHLGQHRVPHHPVSNRTACAFTCSEQNPRRDDRLEQAPDYRVRHWARTRRMPASRDFHTCQRHVPKYDASLEAPRSSARSEQCRSHMASADQCQMSTLRGPHRDFKKIIRKRQVNHTLQLPFDREMYRQRWRAAKSGISRNHEHPLNPGNGPGTTLETRVFKKWNKPEEKQAVAERAHRSQC